jgi:Aerobic-type carbon monoxide dehydrogenase, large subunit CoxL/CutL homologs
MVMGDTDLCPYDAGTWGSLSTRMFGPAVRAAAAEARTVLLKLAAERLGTPAAQLVVENGVVSNGMQRVTYGELAKGKQITRLVGEKAVLRSVKEFKVIGKPARRMEPATRSPAARSTPATSGCRGMLYAQVLRPPVPRRDAQVSRRLEGKGDERRDRRRAGWPHRCPALGS